MAKTEGKNHQQRASQTSSGEDSLFLQVLMAFSKYPSSTWSVKARYSLGNRSSAGRGGLGVNGLRLGVEAGFAGGVIINQAHKGCAPNSN